MKTQLILIFAWVVASSVALAEPPKKGRVLCEGDGCREVAASSDGILNGIVGAVEDFKNRVVRRVDQPGIFPMPRICHEP